MSAPGKWIDHDGGTMPEPDTIREIQLRDGTITTDLLHGMWSRYEWARPNDIIAYRKATHDPQ